MPLRFAVPRSSVLSQGALCVGALCLLSGCQPQLSPERAGQTQLPADGRESAAPSEPKPDANVGAATGASSPALSPAQPDSPTPAAPTAPGTTAAADATDPAPASPALSATSPPQSQPVPSPPVQDDAGGRAWLAMSDLPYEYWETQYLNAQRIGVTHYKIERAGAERLTLTATSHLEVQRAGQPIRQTVVVQTIERSDGQVDSYFEDIQGGGVATKATGSVSDGKMPLRITNGANKSSTTVPWPSGAWGPMGVHQLLLRQPMRAGERRQAQVFLPQIHKMARVSLVAGKEEDTTSPEGLLHNLLPVDVVMQLENEGISNRVWMNARGEVQKSVMTIGLNLSSYRVDREVAQRVVAQGQVDLLEAAAIKLDKPLVDADKAQKIVYAVEAKSTDPFALLSGESNQSVRSETAFRSELTVYRPSLESETPEGAKQTPPGPECLAASPLIKSDDPLVEKMAARLAADVTEPAATAQKLTEGVYASIRKKNFSRSFDSAQDVARTLEGDCTEHAVLLAALLRNRGIPARLASGVIVQTRDQQSECVYHMWTEAWTGQRWLPLDATRGGLAGCGHIKFLETPLADSNPYVALLPVMTSLGQLTISVEEVVP